MSDVIGLFNTDFFQIGLRFGLLALALGWIATWALRRFGRLLPIGGIMIAAFTLGALIALGEGVRVEGLAFGLILGGTALIRLLRAPDWVTPLAAAPGALFLAIGTSVTDLVWVRIVLAVLVPVCGYLITDFERRYQGLGLGVIFFTLAALGVFVAVPDTEWARVLIAVAVPITFLAWPKVVGSLGPEGSYLAVATLIVVAGQGGGPRPASIVGSIACLGLLVLEPIAIAISPSIVAWKLSMRQNWAGAVIASLPQFVVVALCSRVAARFTDWLPAFIVVVIVFLATIAVGIWASPVGTSDTRSS